MNRLADAASPYLRQHAADPVDWYPWGDEAFERAREQDLPVFVSIGYASCHWCHVMAAEVFAHPEVAALMNENFVCIKVDRQEHPQVDTAGMLACQMLTGTGGWPLTLIMTPDGHPFFAATYVPRVSDEHHLGMLDLIPRISTIWQERREDIFTTATNLGTTLQQFATRTTTHLDERILRVGYTGLAKTFDAPHGGFGHAPKFPNATLLFFLMRYHHRTGEPRALAMVEQSLKAMRAGGIYDQADSGFHRYSTDEVWRTPHFEKMLYDQALMAMAYTEAYLITDHDPYFEAAEDILTYVLETLGTLEGVFIASEDADSDGGEGEFYLWHTDELREILSEEEFALLARTSDIRDEGNMADASGLNVLCLAKADPEDENALADIFQTLKQTRASRPRPRQDRQILTDWNGLMIAALAKAARLEPFYESAAAKAADFFLENLIAETGRLAHLAHPGHPAPPGSLDDYAFLIWGLLELYETTFTTRYLEAALQLTHTLIKDFWDEAHAGFTHPPIPGPDLPIPPRIDATDQMIPGGSAVALLCFARLSAITGDESLRHHAQILATSFAADAADTPEAHGMFLCALDFFLGPPAEVVISGDLHLEATRTMVAALYSYFLPRTTIVFRPENDPGDPIHRICPLVEDKPSIDSTATAYVCHQNHCAPPTTEYETLLDLLDI